MDGARERQLLPSNQVEMTFGNHEHNILDPAVMQNSDKFSTFLNNPQSSYPSELVLSVIQSQHNEILALDSVGSLGPKAELDTEVQKINKRFLLVESLPFMGDAKQIMLVNADPFLGSFVSDKLPLDAAMVSDISYDVIDSSSSFEVILANFKDMGRQEGQVLLFMGAIFFLVQHLKEKKLKVSRRTFLTMLGSGLLAPLGGRVISTTMLDQSLTLNQSTQSLTYEISKILAPHFNMRSIVDGRTALLFSACAFECQKTNKKGQVILGREHKHFADEIMRSKEVRVQAIRELYKSYMQLIQQICAIVQSPLSEAEVRDLAASMMKKIQTAVIQKPNENEAQQAFDHPENFVSIKDMEELPELTAALAFEA